MRKYSGYVRYSANNSGRAGQYVVAELTVSFPPGRFAITTQDENHHTRHELTNRRINYQAMDSPQDLLARGNGEDRGLADSQAQSTYPAPSFPE